MKFVWVNDWMDDDGFWCMPDPLFIFNLGAGMSEGGAQISCIFMGLGFVLMIGEPIDDGE